MLIRYDHSPQVFERVVEQIDARVKQHGILSMPENSPLAAFAEGNMQEPRLHLRLAYADDRRWAGIYDLDHLPAAIAGLLADSKALAHEVFLGLSGKPITGDEAHGYLAPDMNQAQSARPAIVAKVTVTRAGVITVNSVKVSLDELCAVLDELKVKQGGVWYHREDPTGEPSESTLVVIKQVLDEVMARKLPIQLQEESI